MATTKYSRVDGRKSSSYWSTIAIVAFVAVCLVGAWMFMSSSSVEVQNTNFSSQEATEKVEAAVTKTDEKQFEDGSDNLEIGVKKEDDDGVPVEESEKKIKENEEEEVETEKHEEKKETENSPSENQDENSGEKDESREEKKDEGEEKDSETKEIEVEGSEKSKTEENQPEESSGENKTENVSESEENTDENVPETGENVRKSSNETFPAGDQAEITKETTAESEGWGTQLVESQNEKKSQQSSFDWKVCNVTAGPDYIPCLDNWQAIKKLHSTSHYEHRERHCPEEPPTCLVSLPEGYKRSVKWSKSREKIWYANVPHTKLAEVKGHQNWVKVSGEYLTFPGGGTQFKNGALHYIDFLQESHPDIAWGNRTRVILDVGCGVASFGGYLFERDVLAMSLAPKDEHEAQVQFALERGIPAVLNVMGTKRLPYPGSVFDAIHCARCRVPWHIEGGKLLLELNRVLRPGGFFIWSATPVYRKNEEDSGIWKAMSELTKAMCWKLVTINKDQLNEVGAAVYQKPTSNKCYDERSKTEPPLCEESDDPNAAWNVPLQACMHRAPEDESKRGAVWPKEWPERLEAAPQWLDSQVGVYGKSGPEDFAFDYKHWKNVVSKSYLSGMGIDWSYVRNVMDMRAVYGGFAAALKDLKVWVMNVVPIDSPDTLPIIYDRGLFGMYHDWCESFNTYPRTYDLLHADHLFSSLKKRCNLVSVIAEVDRILRPQGTFIVRDDAETVGVIERMVKSMKWEVRMTYSKNGEGLLSVQKSRWRPTEAETIKSAIA